MTKVIDRSKSVADGQPAISPDASAPPPPPDKLTLYTEDGQWKAELKAWKDYWFFYNSIGASVDVYHRETTHDTWGNKTNWVKRPASIFISNFYQGSIAGSPTVPQNPPDGPPNGGMGDYTQAGEVNSDHAELRLWATGFFTTKIQVSGERTRPNGAILDISSVVSEIAVATPSGPMRGVVGASSYVSDNSAWG